MTARATGLRWKCMIRGASARHTDAHPTARDRDSTCSVRVETRRQTSPGPRQKTLDIADGMSMINRHIVYCVVGWEPARACERRPQSGPCPTRQDFSSGDWESSIKVPNMRRIEQTAGRSDRQIWCRLRPAIRRLSTLGLGSAELAEVRPKGNAPKSVAPGVLGVHARVSCPRSGPTDSPGETVH